MKRKDEGQDWMLISPLVDVQNMISMKMYNHRDGVKTKLMIYATNSTVMEGNVGLGDPALFSTQEAQ